MKQDSKSLYTIKTQEEIEKRRIAGRQPVEIPHTLLSIKQIGGIRLVKIQRYLQILLERLFSNDSSSYLQSDFLNSIAIRIFLF
jgi:hypothetical protein